MNKKRRSIRLNLDKFPILLVAIIFSLLVFEDKATAQAADVPKPNINGDFKSIFVQGNRGFYAVQKWLVIQSLKSEVNDDSLNCRYNPNGKIRSRIQMGAILTAVFKKPASGRVLDPRTTADDAIVLDSSGLPWLRVIGTREELAYPVRPLTFDDLGVCYVRANLKYIAPINPDVLSFYDQKISRSYCTSKPLYCLTSISQWLSLR